MVLIPLFHLRVQGDPRGPGGPPHHISAGFAVLGKLSDIGRSRLPSGLNSSPLTRIRHPYCARTTAHPDGPAAPPAANVAVFPVDASVIVSGPAKVPTVS